MERTMRKYARRIGQGEVNPHCRYDGRSSGLILDPAREDVPLEVLGFGIYRLGRDYVERETGEREMVLVPQEGAFEAEVNGRKYSAKRAGGPFAEGPGRTNASALYVPRNSRLRIRGTGEVAFYEAHALADKPPLYFPPASARVISRGAWVWRRDIVNLVSPADASTNLVVGETWSPPGFWSGTPLHVHDKEDPAAGESDMEEVYFHRLNLDTPAGSQFDAYAVQLLFDGTDMMQSFIIGDKSIMAIPGGAHPVVASPVCDMLYLWGLAGNGGALRARDIPEFKHLKDFERVLADVMKGTSPQAMPAEAFNARAASYGFTPGQSALLRMMLSEMGVRVE